MIKQLKNGAYEYNEKDFLGQGSFAKVYKGIITKNNRVIAVRILPLKLIKQYGEKIKEIIRGQVAVLKQLSQSDSIDSLFTTRIYDCFLTQNNVTMILQFCPDGNLQDVLTKKGALPEKQALEIMYQLARGIQFIAKQKVVHRDIKPDNIFLKKEKAFMLYKLGDFGFAVKKQINKETVGTPIFMSPQLFRGQAYGSQVDVWAFGLLCHYILFKQYYFIANSQKQIQNRVLKQPYKLKNSHMSRISPLMADFLTNCLQMDKYKRIKATQITKHPVFNPVRDRVQTMAQQIRNLDSQFQSKLMLQSPKGVVANLLMKFQFLYNLAGVISQLDPSSVTSLYMIKYNLAHLFSIRKAYQQKQNFINHPGWGEFASSSKYPEMYKLLDSIFTTHQHCFETQYNRHMSIISSKYGPGEAQKVQSNLGSGPYDFIDPRPIIYDLGQNWKQRFKMHNNNYQLYLRGLQCVVAIAIYHNKNLNLDFVKITMNSMSFQDKARMIQEAFKNS